jgi:hypothetical protein
MVHMISPPFQFLFKKHSKGVATTTRESEVWIGRRVEGLSEDELIAGDSCYVGCDVRETTQAELQAMGRANVADASD